MENLKNEIIYIGQSLTEKIGKTIFIEKVPYGLYFSCYDSLPKDKINDEEIYNLVSKDIQEIKSKNGERVKDIYFAENLVKRGAGVYDVALVTYLG